MKNVEKVNKVCNWLKQGYYVCKYGSQYVVMIKAFSTLCVYHDWVYRTDYSKREVGGYINDMFNDTEFYAITNEGKFECTNPEYENLAKKEYTFTFINSDTNEDLFTLNVTFEFIIANYYELAENWSIKHSSGKVTRFAIKSNYPHNFNIHFTLGKNVYHNVKGENS